MIYIIQTIGQRDAQLHYKKPAKEDEKASDYSGFDKSSLFDVQKELWALLKQNRLKWKPIQGVEGKKQDLTQMELINSSYNICFPFTEHIFSFLKKKAIENSAQYKFILIYNDRQRSKLAKEFIKNEPYYFAELIKHFWQEMTNYYQIQADIEIINFCDSMKDNWEIYAEFAFSAIDRICSNLSDIIHGERILLFNDGGMPVVSKAIEITLPAYFPRQIIFMEQNFGKISENKQHIIQKQFSLKFSIIQDIKQFDFVGLYKDALELGLKNTDPVFWDLTRICKSWLYDDKNISQLILNDFIKSNPDYELIAVLKVMNSMLDSKNAMACNLIRCIQEVRNENWWSTSTLLISVGELFIIESLKSKYPQAVVEDTKKWFKISIFPFEVSTSEITRSVNYNDRDLYMINWKTIDIVLSCGIDGKEDLQDLKDLLIHLKIIKEARNAFIHQGITIPKVLINEALKFDTRLKTYNSNCKSKTFKYLIEETSRINHLDFINWIPILQKELFERAKKLSPIENL
ncbi:MAG: hypothetical protein PHR06_13900 [Candidatus Cloacimonetes bacterium]|nr:hypothetical protein [Candidatus Cloacimonadota bacterium]